MLVRVPTPQKHIHDLQFSPFYHNKLACASGQFYGLAGSGCLFIITLPDGGVGEPLVQCFPWSDSLFAVAWSEKNDHVVITGAGDGSLQVYDVSNPKGLITTVKGHSREVSSVNWCQNRLYSHLLMSASWDLSIKLWNGETMQEVSHLPNTHNALVYDVQSSPLVQGLFASCSGDGYVKLWSMKASTQPVAMWKGHDAEILSMDWCKYDENILVSSDTGGLVKVWDLRNPGKPLMVLVGHRYAVRRVRFSPYHSSLIASSSYDFTVKTWDYRKHNHSMETFNHHTEFVCGLDFNLHKPMQICSGSWDESVAVWSLS